MGGWVATLQHAWELDCGSDLAHARASWPGQAVPASLDRTWCWDGCVQSQHRSNTELLGLNYLTSMAAEYEHKSMPSEQSMSNITCVIPHATPRTAMRHLCAMHLIVVYMGSVGEEDLQA